MRHYLQEILFATAREARCQKIDAICRIVNGLLFAELVVA